MSKVRDGRRRTDVGEDQVIIIPHGGSPLRREIGRAIRADGGNEPELLLLDHSPHISRKNAHRIRLLALKTPPSWKRNPPLMHNAAPRSLVVRATCCTGIFPKSVACSTCVTPREWNRWRP